MLKGSRGLRRDADHGCRRYSGTPKGFEYVESFGRWDFFVEFTGMARSEISWVKFELMIDNLEEKNKILGRKTSFYS